MSSFEVWWNTFPLHDGFKIGSKNFLKTRGLRVSKEDCKKLFEKIIAEGPYTAEHLIQALKAHISNAKNLSLKKGENKLSFIHNSATYLRQGDYVAWIGDEEVKVGEVRDAVSRTTFEL